MAAGLDAHIINADDKVDTEKGRFKVGKYIIHDTHPRDSMTATEIITQSSNIGSAKIAMRLGKTKFHAFLTRLGFGTKTDIELPGEVEGILRPPRKWSEVALANIAFGQGVAVNAVQMCTALAAIANGGVLMRPRIVERVVEHGSPTNRSVAAYPPEARGRVFSAETARTLTTMMRGVTGKQGTAKQAAVPGYGVAGKTGTAQKADPVSGGYAADSWVSSFMGFVPSSAPRLAIAVIVDEPQGEHRGGLVAAPTFKRIAEETLKYLGVPQVEPIEPASTSAAAGAAVKKPALPTPPALAETPASGVTTGAVGGEDHGENAVGQAPNFRGMTIREAIAAAKRAGIALDVEGSGRAIKQEPAAGTTADRCLVRFGNFGCAVRALKRCPRAHLRP